MRSPAIPSRSVRERGRSPVPPSSAASARSSSSGHFARVVARFAGDLREGAFFEVVFFDGARTVFGALAFGRFTVRLGAFFGVPELFVFVLVAMGERALQLRGHRTARVLARRLEPRRARAAA